MSTSSYAKNNLAAVIASQIRSMDTYDRLAQTSLSEESFEDKTNILSGGQPQFHHQKSNDFLVTGLTSPASIKSNFDSNNNSLPLGSNDLTASMVTVCQPQIFDVDTSPLLIQKQVKPQRKSKVTKRPRDSESQTTIPYEYDVSSSSSPSLKRRKSPQFECNAGSTMQFSNFSTTPLQQNPAILPDTTSVTAASLPYEITVNGKKKGTKGSVGASGARRNERERNRVKQVNLGFDKLREHVPQGRQNKKLSKVDTLKAAVGYIQQLQKILGLTEEFLTNSQNFDAIISDKIIDEETFDDESDDDSESFNKKMNSNEVDYDNGLTVLAKASCLAEKENLFAENPLIIDSKQEENAEFRSQTSISDHYFVNNQSCVAPNEQFNFQGNTMLTNDPSKINTNEFHLEELISSLSSQQQDLLMGTLNSASTQVDLHSNFPPPFVNNFVTCQQKSNDVLTAFQPNFDHLINQQTSEKYGSLLEVLMNESVDLFMDLKQNNNSVDDNLPQFRPSFNPRI